jgi:hypothetical protein
LKDGLGDKATSMIVTEVVADATIDSQIITLAGSKADVFFEIAEDSGKKYQVQS